MKLIATKPFSYATRRLQANDEFEATNAHARLLVAIGKAKESDKREKGKLAAPSKKLKKKAVKAVAPKKAKAVETKPAAEPAPEAEAVGAMTTKTVKPPVAKAAEPAVLAEAPVDDLTALRQQYKDKFGKSPFMGWSVTTLQDKLAEK
jgi:hypothetical protein